jgi:hypothetical protein
MTVVVCVDCGPSTMGVHGTCDRCGSESVVIRPARRLVPVRPPEPPKPVRFPELEAQ